MTSVHRLMQRLRHALAELARPCPDRREMNMLLRADERLLKDIGLTRSDAQVLAKSPVMAKAAAVRRKEAIAAANQRRVLSATANPQAQLSQHRGDPIM